MPDSHCPDPELPAEYRVAVRSLCEFTARSGDLDFRFTPAPSAEQGMAGHAILAARRGSGYQRELTLEVRYKNLIVRGRADGFDPQHGRLEEFKTHRGALQRLPDNQRRLHWAQLRMYGAMLCMQHRCDDLELALVYFDVRTEEETVIAESRTAVDLRAHFSEQCESFLRWATLETRHRERRDRFLGSMRFPRGCMRAGQRQMAEAVYRTALHGRPLMVQAPTGTGKTFGSLFPLLKAVPKRKLDRIFYLVAKTSGRKLALDALTNLGTPSAPATLRVLELVSKESACLHPGRSCDAQSCPLARGFYDRLPQARLAAMAHSRLSEEAVRAIAAEAGICPYHLTHELARWCDVIVGDYNYYFDTSAILHGLTAQNQWRVGLLVDEAHNLLSRAREMYSAGLEPAVFEAAAPAATGTLKRRLQQVRRAWSAVQGDRVEEYFALADIPRPLTAALQRFNAAVADEAAESAEIHASVLGFHFEAVHFCRMADAFGPDSLFDAARTATGVRLCIRNVCPAPFLAPRFAATSTAVLFSATLGPAEFHRRLLGLPDDTAWLDVDSPFGAGQLDVRVEPRISTRFRDRRRSLLPIAELIAGQFRADPGNYLAFFSSFDYLHSVLEVFRERHPDLTAWEQVRGMPTVAKDDFLARFTPTSRGIGFAVLGGAFAEGVDLPGKRLIGAFIATLGLPRMDGVNAEIERRMQSLFDAGYEFTYLYPGLQKVVQAAGRVIRSDTDRGTVVLIDDRYMGRRVRQLLPRWWQIRCH